ncbi:uncharacterized protein K489DRAFT_33205 [Dissoconium aciculare CBS 342.82]|uniref:Uncharacterized protein n=1 Tax=Dissoconium aciculare CBS 342.82 TaxID=1314786 RepID=A0A6J3M0N4_9PEZI|nr:uncharacterized protein K489DRAFT_33205 [Dissoconium aciculare CBS 342.82]KAF1820462.1 hypothetical protein K489DRAFT_33205 [Dissoconium aciculare CBS 342.82]
MLTAGHRTDICSAKTVIVTETITSTVTASPVQPCSPTTNAANAVSPEFVTTTSTTYLPFPSNYLPNPEQSPNVVLSTVTVVPLPATDVSSAASVFNSAPPVYSGSSGSPANTQDQITHIRVTSTSNIRLTTTVFLPRTSAGIAVNETILSTRTTTRYSTISVAFASPAASNPPALNENSTTQITFTRAAPTSVVMPDTTCSTTVAVASTSPVTLANAASTTDKHVAPSMPAIYSEVEYAPRYNATHTTAPISVPLTAAVAPFTFVSVVPSNTTFASPARTSSVAPIIPVYGSPSPHSLGKPNTFALSASKLIETPTTSPLAHAYGVPTYNAPPPPNTFALSAAKFSVASTSSCSESAKVTNPIGPSSQTKADAVQPPSLATYGTQGSNMIGSPALSTADAVQPTSLVAYQTRRTQVVSSSAHTTAGTAQAPPPAAYHTQSVNVASPSGPTRADAIQPTSLVAYQTRSTQVVSSSDHVTAGAAQAPSPAPYYTGSINVVSSSAQTKADAIQPTSLAAYRTHDATKLAAPASSQAAHTAPVIQPPHNYNSPPQYNSET